jgi:peptidoglycan/LPS O-acetylase OafA/YrhL
MLDTVPVQVRKTTEIPSYSVHLDAARALAALIVFLGHGTYLLLGTTIHEQVNGKLNHAAAAANSYNPAAHTHLGHQAVIIFFVLSGYFVGGGALRSVRRQQWSTKSYLLKRLTRLWIVLIPALLLTALVDLIGIHWFHDTSAAYSNMLRAGFAGTWSSFSIQHAIYTFAGNLFFLQGILVPCFGSNGPLWSLSYEFWYYIMFPLLLASLMRSVKMPRRAGAIIALVALLVFCGKDISLYFLIWMMGALTSLLAFRIPWSFARWIAPSMCVLFAAFNLYAVVHPYNLAASDFTTGIFFSVVLWLLLHYDQPARESLYRKISQKLSAMSYTLYAVHYPIILLLSTWLVSKSSHRHISVLSVVVLLAAYAAAFLIAYLCYRCFEANTGRVRRFLSARLGVQ